MRKDFLNYFVVAFLLLFSMGFVSCEEESLEPVSDQEQVDNQEDQEETAEDDPIEEGGPNAAFSYLALGDSYTIGASVTEAERWPVQLVDRLRSHQIDIKNPRIIAQTGWTTGSLLNAIDRADDLKESYDCVSLLIGVNNQFQGRSLDEYRQQYEQLLDVALSKVNQDTSRVIVLSIPDYGVTPFGENYGDEVSQEIDEFNGAKRAITERKGVAFFDITPISRQVPSDPDLVAGDDLHPSGKMYGLWVEEVFDYVKAELNQ
ncbi:SGNH/GDSL hydrolase family protein [Reichenbachiella ulvae]|uniref:SGNH/GDSL hydrolase family protein n=1 Tax=Reichenbachiella ulvae TaxID=2980104 RepID=A0ABT3CSI6_9BACT|nr:SGNH/GDSL hydrolase family protein [Reichenbachiella ulvae]MCV9386609.1 SGNH/GDSL hydrolase family protein [Reichenbachiella ulvae]